VELKEKAEKKISALHERIRSLSAEMVDVKVKNGAAPPSNHRIIQLMQMAACSLRWQRRQLPAQTDVLCILRLIRALVH
jgi:hypothetical protein